MMIYGDSCFYDCILLRIQRLNWTVSHLLIRRSQEVIESLREDMCLHIVVYNDHMHSCWLLHWWEVSLPQSITNFRKATDRNMSRQIVEWIKFLPELGQPSSTAYGIPWYTQPQTAHPLALAGPPRREATRLGVFGSLFGLQGSLW